ncbi:MAG: GAF domain-containing sensor histidine kinase [Chloroflexota bacterium]|nr:GAF domain-containing sensor histidine kinase [Chloroflexota bacterium]
MARGRAADDAAADRDGPHEGWSTAATEISTAILEGAALAKVLRLIADAARRLVGGDYALIATPAVGSASLLVRVVSGGGAGALRGMPIPGESSLAGAAMTAGNGLVIGDAQADPRAYGAKVGALRIGPLIVMPLSARGHAFGILEVSRVRGRQPFEAGDLERVAAFAGQASIALEYARAQRELRRLAVMDDRERIARELHDGAIQSLFAVGMELQATALRASNEKVKSRLQESVDRIDAVIRDLRGYIFGLRPNILEDRTLEQSLEQLGVEFEERSGVLVVSEIDARVAKAMEPIAGEVVQIAREAISNVGRHSGATTCRLSLRRAEGGALLEIADDGTGFDPSTVGPGQGLRDMRERAAALGGSVEIVAAASKGTDVRVSLPVPEAV